MDPPERGNRNNKGLAGKAVYTSPRLSAYGSVRNLTGGSGGRQGDGGINMNRGFML